MGTTAMSRDNLIRWLDGDWALHFSHPEDFDCGGLEADRWRTVVGDAFAASRVRPLVSSGAQRSLGASWVTQIGGLEARLPDLPELRNSDNHVVTVLDDVLGVRRQFIYGTSQRLPSVLDLVAATWMLRTAPRSAGRSSEARNPERQEMLIEQIWRSARSVTMDHLVQPAREGLQRGLQWLGQDVLAAGEDIPPFRPDCSLNGGW